jgi:hypothetical protein
VKQCAWIVILASLAAAQSPAAELTLRIPPFASALKIEGQPVAITVWGTISGTASGDGKESLRLKLDADFADLQRQITPILKAQLNQDNRCGERLSLEQAVLSPDAPGARLRAKVHYEKWGCVKAFGKEIVKKLIGGNGSIEVRLTPVVENADTVRLRADVSSIEADGQLGEILRSGSFGEALQEKIRKTVADDLEKSARLQEGLPNAVREIAILSGVRFVDAGQGSLGLSVTGEARIGAQQAQALLAALKSN